MILWLSLLFEIRGIFKWAWDTVFWCNLMFFRLYPLFKIRSILERAWDTIMWLFTSLAVLICPASLTITLLFSSISLSITLLIYFASLTTTLLISSTPVTLLIDTTSLTILILPVFSLLLFKPLHSCWLLLACLRPRWLVLNLMILFLLIQNTLELFFFVISIRIRIVIWLIVIYFFTLYQLIGFFLLMVASCTWLFDINSYV